MDLLILRPMEAGDDPCAHCIDEKLRLTEVKSFVQGQLGDRSKTQAALSTCVLSCFSCIQLFVTL